MSINFQGDVGAPNLVPNIAHYDYGEVHSSPWVQYEPYYWFTRYPKETTKVWNLVYLFTPTSWMWTFLSIFSIVLVMSSFTLVYEKLEIGTMTEEIILFPYR